MGLYSQNVFKFIIKGMRYNLIPINYENRILNKNTRLVQGHKEI